MFVKISVSMEMRLKTEGILVLLIASVKAGWTINYHHTAITIFTHADTQKSIQTSETLYFTVKIKYDICFCGNAV